METLIHYTLTVRERSNSRQRVHHVRWLAVPFRGAGVLSRLLARVDESGPWAGSRLGTMPWVSRCRSLQVIAGWLGLGTRE